MKQEQLKNGEYYLMSGPGRLELKSGTLEIIGTKVEGGFSIDLPAGKKIPLFCVLDSELATSFNSDSFTKLDSAPILPEWEKIVERIVREKKEGKLFSVVILGEVDSGKTFFSTYIANKLVGKISRIGLLDCDAGQSDLGPPGTFGMLIFRKQTIILSEEKPSHLAMIGAHSPGLHFLPTVSALLTMVRKAQREADLLIVDSTGWVQGDGGRALKKAKLDIINPDLVILIQKGRELEHLVKHLPKEKIERMPVSKRTTPLSHLERKAMREARSADYFKDSKIIEVPFDQVCSDRAYFLSGSYLNLEGTLWAERLSGWEGTLVVTSGPLLPEMTKNWPKDLGRIMNFIAGEEKGLMVGMLDSEQNLMSLARLEEFDFLKNVFRLRTPYKGDVKKIKCIQFGSLKINERGLESGYIEPGNF
ncbi:MAG: hypothetical protein HQM08_30715 [Candidatus Riflebacteria bacterium]|nr:hypothetical protein [Candidatus Riflebacteria bacterium]